MFDDFDIGPQSDEIIPLEWDEFIPDGWDEYTYEPFIYCESFSCEYRCEDGRCYFYEGCKEI